MKGPSNKESNLIDREVEDSTPKTYSRRALQQGSMNERIFLPHGPRNGGGAMDLEDVLEESVEAGRSRAHLLVHPHCLSRHRLEMPPFYDSY